MNYSDKDFKDLYQEILDEVKTLTTHWNPEVSDEADPGVAILKAYTLFIDKLNYSINYKNAQNSVKQVTDLETAKDLFFDLGYKMVGRRSANGELSIKLLSSSTVDNLTIPLFSQFTDSNGKINFTSIRASVTLEKGGNNKLVKVQEGIPVQYTYEDRRIFNQNDLTSNLRLPIYGYSNISENGIIICSINTSDPEADPQISDWLNTGENIFTTVETKNIYSIGCDSEGSYYIQFYEDSLAGLKDGVKIWVISSSGYGGNIPANKITRVLDSIEGQDYLVITHNAFTNGADEESIKSARDNYYQSFGVNNTLVSERDYSEVIESLIAPTLNKLVSKALVTGIDGNHNLAEILSILDNGSRAILIRQVAIPLSSYIYVNVLKPYFSNNNYQQAYEESFEYLVDDDTINLIKKALFEKSLVSNDLKLVNNSDEVYDRYLYDVCDLVGRVVIDSNEEVDDILEKIIKIICDNFNSSKLTEGEEIDETNISKIISDNLPGVVGSSFYLDNHKLKKSLTGDDLTIVEKIDLVAREILKGDISLFEDNSLQVPPASYKIGSSAEAPNPEPPINPISGISKIDTEFDVIGSASNYNLEENEFIQVYREATETSQVYGIGIRYRLVSLLSEPISNNKTLSETTTLLQGTLIKTGSKIAFTPGSDPTLQASINPTPDELGRYEFISDYTVQNSIVARSNSILASSSELCIQQTLYDNLPYNLDKLGLKLYLKNGDNPTEEIISQISIEGFEEGLSSLPYSDPSPTSNDLLLSSSQKINKLSVPSVKLDSKYYYGLILNNKNELVIPANGNVLLGENEHLIYSDSDLLDFVDFGSGTLIKNPSSINLVLKNVVDIETDNFMAEGVLQKLPGIIEVVNTEISTFIGKSYRVNFTGFGVDELKFNSDKDFLELSNTKYITISENGNNKTYGNDYYLRGGLVVNTGMGGIYNLHQSQYLIITIDSFIPVSGSTVPTWEENTYYSRNGDEYTLLTSQPANWSTNYTDYYTNKIKIGSSSIENSYISFSSGLILGTGGYLPDSSIIQAQPFDLSVGNPNGLTPRTSYSFTSGFSIEGSGNVTYANTEFFKLSLNGYSYLLNLTIDSGSDYNIWLKGNNGKVFELNSSQISEFNTSGDVTLSSEIGSGEKTFYLYLSGYDTLGFIVDTVNTPFNITINSFDRLVGGGGYNSNLFYSDGDTSEEFTEDNAEDLFTRVRNLSYDNSNPVPFDFNYRPASPLNTPTKTLQIYDSRHILNRNLLTKIDLDSDRLKNNLIIIRRNKW